MARSDFAKAGKFAALRRLVIFNFAAVVGFLLGTAGFTASMMALSSATFSWLFGNCIGGLSHFGANWVMQGQSKKEMAKCFVVFNATGILSFLFASATFAVALVLIDGSTTSWLIANESTISWLAGSVVGTLSHFVMNEKGMKVNLSRCKIPGLKTT